MRSATLRSGRKKVSVERVSHANTDRGCVCTPNENVKVKHGRAKETLKIFYCFREASRSKWDRAARNDARARARAYPERSRFLRIGTSHLTTGRNKGVGYPVRVAHISPLSLIDCIWLCVIVLLILAARRTAIAGSASETRRRLLSRSAYRARCASSLGPMSASFFLLLAAPFSLSIFHSDKRSNARR